MNGRARIEAAFSPKGTEDPGAVICYEGIYVRDHWSQLTQCPWWYRYSPDLSQQLAWHCDVIEATGQDWFALPDFYSTHMRESMSIQGGEDEAYLRVGGQPRILPRPRVGGWSPQGALASVRPEQRAGTPSEIDAQVPLPDDPPERIGEDGRGDLAAALLKEFGDSLYPIRHVLSPLWSCYQLWGFEDWMVMIAERPDLVRYACSRFLDLRLYQVRQAAALGTAGIWIEDCMTDMIRPQAFADLNLPTLRELVAAIREAGMRSIYYYCGDPSDRWDLLLETGTDALSLEESKKGFCIDIAQVVDRVQGRCVVLGNLDAFHVLERESDGELRKEIDHQLSAGRRNGGRFIMSLGSPVTPGTPPERVRRYCDLVHVWRPAPIPSSMP